MKRMKYIGSLSMVEFQDYGTVKRGETIDLPDDVADSVVAANPDAWESASNPAPAREE